MWSFQCKTHLKRSTTWVTVVSPVALWLNYPHPNIFAAINMLRSFCFKPCQIHWHAAKYALQCISSTSSHGTFYHHGTRSVLDGMILILQGTQTPINQLHVLSSAWVSVPYNGAVCNKHSFSLLNLLLLFFTVITHLLEPFLSHPHQIYSSITPLHSCASHHWKSATRVWSTYNSGYLHHRWV